MIIGVVGKPSVGKSTFFKASTLADVDIANYPFTTIKPNHAVGFVKVQDAAIDFNKVANPRTGYVQGEYRFVPVDLMDVAGLVPGAHEGQGMGNAFLNDLNQADALIHVIDISGSVNEKGEPVEPLSYNPANDIKFLELELDYWYKAILKKGWDKFARKVQQSNQELYLAIAEQLSGIGATEEMSKEIMLRIGLNTKNPTTFTEEDIMLVASEFRKKTKPMIIAANKIDVPGAYENFEKLKKEFPDYMIVPCSSESELALKEACKHELINYISGEKGFTITEKGESALNDAQKGALNFIKTNILEKYEYATGVQECLNESVFKLLDYIAIHPGGVGKLEDSNGNTLPDCFLMKNGSTTLDFAFKLHTDFGKNFIRAIDVRTKLPKGKDHVMKHLDIYEIMSN